MESSARTAIHFSHRLGAVLVTLAILLLAWRMSAIPASVRQHWRKLLLGLLCLQLILGISNVVWSLPLAVAVSHNKSAYRTGPLARLAGNTVQCGARCCWNGGAVDMGKRADSLVNLRFVDRLCSHLYLFFKASDPAKYCHRRFSRRCATVTGLGGGHQ